MMAQSGKKIESVQVSSEITDNNDNQEQRDLWMTRTMKPLTFLLLLVLPVTPGLGQLPGPGEPFGPGFENRPFSLGDLSNPGQIIGELGLANCTKCIQQAAGYVCTPIVSAGQSLSGQKKLKF